LGGGHAPVLADQESGEDAGGETWKASVSKGGGEPLGEFADLVHLVVAHGTPFGRVSTRLLQ
jgi:hypothetical protein